jgi:hypothetical protein
VSRLSWLPILIRKFMTFVQPDVVTDAQCCLNPELSLDFDTDSERAETHLRYVLLRLRL